MPFIKEVTFQSETLLPLNILTLCLCLSLSISLRTIVKVTGQLDFSFLASSISSLSSCPPLKFLLKNTEKLTGVLHNQNFITK